MKKYSTPLTLAVAAALAATGIFSLLTALSNAMDKYTAAATIEINRQPMVAGSDMDVHIAKLKSVTILQETANRLSPEQKAALMEPYDTMVDIEIILRYLRIEQARMSNLLRIHYTHPDSEVAAAVANACAQAYVDFIMGQQLNSIMVGVEALEKRVSAREQKIQELKNEMAELKKNQESSDSPMPRDYKRLESRLASEKKAEIALSIAYKEQVEKMKLVIPLVKIIDSAVPPRVPSS